MLVPKPYHEVIDRYLNNFRVNQCKLFIQRKCNKHRPFTCFDWHFKNQRRRQPFINHETGKFNYSPDIYCTQYNETSGECENGESCPYLHRNTGDTERRYHLRYFKTSICIHKTDEKSGTCIKNGEHCAFAHTARTLRNPTHEYSGSVDSGLSGISCQGSPTGSSEESIGIGIPNPSQVIQNIINGQVFGLCGTKMSSQERTFYEELCREKIIPDDPKWKDARFVLIHYKTIECSKPMRLCRQGYACPFFHNPKDRRRSPKICNYRSTACPSVKIGMDWKDPSNCPNMDNCEFCHTRTEQQFHPDIYKSTKCQDMMRDGYCPRGDFCAFAHTQPKAKLLSKTDDDEEVQQFMQLSVSNIGNKSKSPTDESSNNSVPAIKPSVHQGILAPQNWDQPQQNWQHQSRQLIQQEAFRYRFNSDSEMYRNHYGFKNGLSASNFGPNDPRYLAHSGGANNVNGGRNMNMPPNGPRRMPGHENLQITRSNPSNAFRNEGAHYANAFTQNQRGPVRQEFQNPNPNPNPNLWANHNPVNPVLDNDLGNFDLGKNEDQPEDLRQDFPEDPMFRRKVNSEVILTNYTRSTNDFDDFERHMNAENDWNDWNDRYDLDQSSSPIDEISINGYSSRDDKASPLGVDSTRSPAGHTFRESNFENHLFGQSSKDQNQFDVEQLNFTGKNSVGSRSFDESPSGCTTAVVPINLDGAGDGIRKTPGRNYFGKGTRISPTLRFC